TRAEMTVWKTAVALRPPSATSRDQASPVVAITCEVCTEAACTTTFGRVAPIRAGAASRARRSVRWPRKLAGAPKMAARALAASTSQSSRAALRPAMTTETGRRAVAAMSKAMRAAKPPVPHSRMSQRSSMSGLLCSKPVPAVVAARGQLVLHDALARRALEIVDDGDVARVLIGREAGAQPARQLCLVDAATGTWLDEELDVLLADIGLDADHGTVLHVRVLGRH